MKEKEKWCIRFTHTVACTLLIVMNLEVNNTSRGVAMGVSWCPETPPPPVNNFLTCRRYNIALLRGRDLCSHTIKFLWKELQSESAILKAQLSHRLAPLQKNKMKAWLDQYAKSERSFKHAHCMFILETPLQNFHLHPWLITCYLHLSTCIQTIAF